MNILLIGLNYHTYTSEIVNELRRLGHVVHFHDIQPSKPWLKVLRKFSPSKYPAALNVYHEGVRATERGWQAEMVLFIQVHQMSHANMASLRKDHASAEFVLYNWDAISNHDYRPYLHYFDRVYTFDPQDARDHGLYYLPLFCITTFQNLRQRDLSGQAVYTVGNIVNPKRYEAIKLFQRYCEANGISFRKHLAGSTNAMTMLLREGSIPWDVSLRPIAPHAFVDLIETSSAVFDFANHRQVGYTMRTIENLCAGKKIITNNPAIKGEAFCTDDRIHVFEGFDFEGVRAFLEKPLRNPMATFPQFHLRSFVTCLTRQAPCSEETEAS